MRRHATVAIVGLLLAGVVSGCAKRDLRDLLAPGEVGTLVVDGRLIVGEPMPPIDVRTTQSPAAPYDRNAAGVVGATVRVVSSAGDTIDYAPYPGSNGRYGAIIPVSDPPPIVRPRTTYSLRVDAPDGRVVTAETTTPDSFRVDEWVLLDDPSLAVRRRLATYDAFPTFPDSVYEVESNQLIYQDGLLEARFARRGALGFQVGLFSLESNSPYVIEAKFLSEEDLRKLKRATASPPFDAIDNSIRLPWFAIFFEGRYRIEIYSIDRNWYDVARTVLYDGDANPGFGGNAGDTVERPIFHVNGGIGLFGSGAVDKIGFTVHPRP
jgi:hypothetical protein